MTTEWIQEIEQRREQLPRRIKIRKYFITPLIPAFSQREKEKSFLT
jgi:hypothetical protein